MDTELTYKFLKYIVLGIVVYFSLRVLHGDKVNNTDTLLISLIIVVGFAILENLKNMFIQPQSNNIPTKCQTEHFSAGLGGNLDGFDSFFDSDNSDNNVADAATDAAATVASSVSDSVTDSISSSGSDDSAFSDLASSFGSDNAFGGNTTNTSTNNPPADETNNNSNAEESSSEESSSEESSSEESSAEEQEEEELVKNIVASEEEIPKQVIMDNGTKKTVYVTYDNGAVYVKDPYTGQQVQGTINNISNVVQGPTQILDVNHPDYVPQEYNPVVSKAQTQNVNEEQMMTMMKNMMSKMVNESSQKTLPAQPTKPNVVSAHNNGNIERGSMRSADGTMDSEMVYNDYNRLPLSEDTGNMDYEYGYTFMPPEKWYPTPPNPPVCVSEKKCPVCPVYTEGTNLELKQWNDSRRVTQPDNMNVAFIRDKLNTGR